MLTLLLASMLSIAFNTAPVSANPDGFILESGDGGIAEWTTAEKKYGVYSVKLSIPDAATEDDYAEVSVPVAIQLGELDLADTYFWCKSTVGDWTPYFIFELETDERINTDGFDSAGYTDWAKYVASASPEFQWSDGTWHSWDDTVEEFGAYTVTAVYVELSGLQNVGEEDFGPFTSYVDGDVMINGVTYDLEPTAEDVIALLKDLKAEINALSAEDFKKPKLAAQRKKALCNKINAVIHQIEDGAYKGAINKLKNDIRPKLDFNNKRSWVATDMSTLLAKIDFIIGILQS